MSSLKSSLWGTFAPLAIAMAIFLVVGNVFAAGGDITSSPHVIDYDQERQKELADPRAYWEVWNDGEVLRRMTPEIAKEIALNGEYTYSPPSVEGAGLELFKITLGYPVNMSGGDVWVQVSEMTKMIISGKHRVPKLATVWFYQPAPASRGGRPEVGD